MPKSQCSGELNQGNSSVHEAVDVLMIEDEQKRT